jgi:hypothetical protein
MSGVFPARGVPGAEAKNVPLTTRDCGDIAAFSVLADSGASHQNCNLLKYINYDSLI